jgi:hypothetical protein
MNTILRIACLWSALLATPFHQHPNRAISPPQGTVSHCKQGIGSPLFMRPVRLRSWTLTVGQSSLDRPCSGDQFTHARLCQMYVTQKLSISRSTLLHIIIITQLPQPCRVPYAGEERLHQGRYDLLPFIPSAMEWVATSGGRIPIGRHPIEGGYEEDGSQLYHATARIGHVIVPGKTGPHLVRAVFPGSSI